MGNENDLKELEKKIPTNELGFLEYERLQLQSKMNKALEEDNIGTYKNLMHAYTMVLKERNDYIRDNRLNVATKCNGEIDVEKTLKNNDKTTYDSTINSTKPLNDYYKIDEKNYNELRQIKELLKNKINNEHIKYWYMQPTCMAKTYLDNNK